MSTEDHAQEQANLLATWKETILEWLNDPNGEDRPNSLRAALLYQFRADVNCYKNHELVDFLTDWVKNGVIGFNQMDNTDLAEMAAGVCLASAVEDYDDFKRWVRNNS